MAIYLLVVMSKEVDMVIDNDTISYYKPCSNKCDVYIYGTQHILLAYMKRPIYTGSSMQFLLRCSTI